MTITYFPPPAAALPTNPTHGALFLGHSWMAATPTPFSLHPTVPTGTAYSSERISHRIAGRLGAMGRNVRHLAVNGAFLLGANASPPPSADAHGQSVQTGGFATVLQLCRPTHREPVPLPNFTGLAYGPYVSNGPPVFTLWGLNDVAGMLGVNAKTANSVAYNEYLDTYRSVTWRLLAGYVWDARSLFDSWVLVPDAFSAAGTVQLKWNGGALGGSVAASSRFPTWNNQVILGMIGLGLGNSLYFADAFENNQSRHRGICRVRRMGPLATTPLAQSFSLTHTSPGTNGPATINFSPVALSGAWTYTRDLLYTSAGYWQTATVGNTLTFTVPSDYPGSGIVLRFCSACSGFGANFSVTVPATATSSAYTLNLTTDGNHRGADATLGTLAVPIALPGVPTAGTPITVTLTSKPSGGSLKWDSAEITAASPRPVIHGGQQVPVLNWLDQTGGEALTAVAQALDADLDTVTAEFPASAVTLASLLPDLLANRTAAFASGGDYTHPTSFGAALVAADLFSGFQSLLARRSATDLQMDFNDEVLA